MLVDVVKHSPGTVEFQHFCMLIVVVAVGDVVVVELFGQQNYVVDVYDLRH